MKYLEITEEQADTLCRDVQVYGRTPRTGVYKLQSPSAFAQRSDDYIKKYLMEVPDESFYIAVGEDDSSASCYLRDSCGSESDGT